MTMVGPLAILAVLSVIGGWVGIGHRFEHFLAPAVGAGAEAAAGAEASGSTELYLTVVSVIAASAGLFFAWLLYSRNKELPAKIANSLGGVYRAVLNKYYVDEIYSAAIVKPLIAFSQAALWHGVDQGVVDAAVNGSASATRRISGGVRQMQSGNVRSYAGWVAAGSAVVIAYMVWAGVR